MIGLNNLFPTQAIGPNPPSLGLSFPVCGLWEESAFRLTVSVATAIDVGWCPPGRRGHCLLFFYILIQFHADTITQPPKTHTFLIIGHIHITSLKTHIPQSY